MTIKGLNHITFAVSDLIRSTDFYTQVLGANLLLTGTKTVYMDLAGIWLALNLVSEPQKPASYTHIAFTVDEADLAIFRQRLQDKCINLEADRPRHPDEGQSLYFRDPDGHLLELHSKTQASRVEYYRQTRKYLQFYNGGNGDGKIPNPGEGDSTP